MKAHIILRSAMTLILTDDIRRTKGEIDNENTIAVLKRIGGNADCLGGVVSVDGSTYRYQYCYDCGVRDCKRGRAIRNAVKNCE